MIVVIPLGWPPFGHEPLTALEQWKASRHRSLWLVVSNWFVSKRAPPIPLYASRIHKSNCFV